MTPTWRGAAEPPPPRLGVRDWLRVLRRGVPIALILAVAFPLLLLLRLPERALFGAHRPWTPGITRTVCRAVCGILGLRREVIGAPMRGPGAFVSNHVSWLDILVLNAGARLTFVAKSEVAGWPGIGWLARGTGTLFIRRDPREAAQQTDRVRARLRKGQRLLFFPEGTSTDGRRVLRFKPALFAGVFDPDLPDVLHVQPISLAYTAPPGAPAAFYGWWGSMALGGSLLAILAVRRQGQVAVVYHPPLSVAAFSDRKTLAQAAEDQVRAGVMARLGPDAD